MSYYVITYLVTLLITFIFNRLLAIVLVRALGLKSAAWANFSLGLLAVLCLSRYGAADFTLITYGPCLAFWLLVDLNRPYLPPKISAADYKEFQRWKENHK